MGKSKPKEAETVVAGTVAALRYGNSTAYEIAKIIIRDLIDSGFTLTDQSE